MAEWKKYKLGEFMQFNPKRILRKGTRARKISMDQLVPFQRDIYNFSYEDYQGGAKFQNGDTIMARITPCLENGKQAFVSLLKENEVAFGSTEYIVLRGKENISDNLFVYYLSRCEYFRQIAIKSMVGSSGRQRVQVDVLENHEMMLPSLEGQKQIADILSSLDDKIEVNRKINENLEQQAEALFKSWFVDFEPFKDGKFIDSELGKIPEGWRVGTFQEIVDIKSGGTPKTTTSEYWNGDIPFFTPKDVSDSAYCFDTEKHITELGLTKCNSALYPKNTIFITARGTVGKISLAGTDMAMNQTCYALVGKTKGIQFYIFWQLFYLVERIKKKANGAVFSAITTKDFDENIVIPPMDYIVKFNNLVLPLFEKIHNLGQENICLSKLRDTLLPKLMSGEINL